MDKIYIPMQVSMLLPGDMYKTLVTLFAFQKEGTITYSKKNSEFLHLDQAIAEQAVQTAINYKLIEPIEQAGGVYKFKINQTVMETAKLTPLTEIPNKPLLKLAETITFKQEMGTKQKTNEELLEEIRRLQAQLMGNVKVDISAPPEHAANDLPW